MAVNAESLSKTVRDIVVAPTEREAAVLSLRRLGKEATEDSVKLFVAAKRALAEQRGTTVDKVRLNLDMFEKLSRKVVIELKETVTVFMVPKANVPNPQFDDHALSQWKEEPENWTSLPASFDKDIYWLLDGGAPRHLLGRGVREISCSRADQDHYQDHLEQRARKTGGDSESAAGSTTQRSPQPAEDQQRAQPPQDPSGEAASAAPETAVRPRVLKLEVSEESDAHGKWVDDLAVASKAAFESEQLLGGTSKTVIFQMRSFTENVEQQAQDAKDAGNEAVFQPWVRGFVRYVTGELLARQCFKALPSFAVYIRRVEAVAPRQVPPTAMALCQLAEVDLAGDGFNTNSLSKWPSKKNEFEQSALFKDYETQLAQARKDRARSATDMEPNERYKLVQSLLASSGEDPELNFACTMMGPAPAVEKLRFVMGDAQRFAFMKAWFPAHGYVLFEPLSHAGGALKDMDAASFLRAAQMLTRDKSCLEAVVHPTAKMLLTAWCTVLEDDCAKVEPGPDFISDAFLQLSAIKLGLSKYETPVRYASAENEAPAFSEALVALLVKTVTPLHKKFADEASGPLMVLGTMAKASAKATKKVTTEAVGTTGVVATAAPTLETAVDGAPGTKAPEPTPVRAEPGPHNVVVGQKVVCLSPGKNKEQWHEKSAEVRTVNASKLKVVLLEGPATGTEVVRSWKQIRIGKEVVPEVVPAAGTAGVASAPEKRPAEGGDVAEAKRLRAASSGAQKAMDIFGSAPDDDEEL